MKGQFFPYKDENKAAGFPYVTLALIIANVAVFIYSLFDYENIIETYGFTPAFAGLLTMFTSMFLHGGLDHIFGNMWFLWLYGDNIEDRMGRLKFILFYLLSGAAAGATHYITNLGSTVPAIGASGAISGVMGAYLAWYPHAKVHTIGPFYQSHLMPAWMLIGYWFVLQLVFGTVSFFGARGSGIAFWAHIGGFVFGYIAAKFAAKNAQEEAE